jgi:hypothetical protein
MSIINAQMSINQAKSDIEAIIETETDNRVLMTAYTVIASLETIESGSLTELERQIREQSCQ